MLVSQYHRTVLRGASTLSDASSFTLTESDDFLGSLASVPPIPGRAVCASEAEPCAVPLGGSPSALDWLGGAGEGAGAGSVLYVERIVLVIFSSGNGEQVKDRNKEGLLFLRETFLNDTITYFYTP